MQFVQLNQLFIHLTDQVKAYKDIRKYCPLLLNWRQSYTYKQGFEPNFGLKLRENVLIVHVGSSEFGFRDILTTF